jgi:polyphosphate kinase 2 (PPK2 family)
VQLAKNALILVESADEFPAAGEVVIFDLSWYNRAGVERCDLRPKKCLMLATRKQILAIWVDRASD